MSSEAIDWQAHLSEVAKILASHGYHMAARGVRDAAAENTRLREALEAAAHWHDSERKSLGKQPPNTDRDWRRTQHSLQAEEIRATLGATRPTAPATEQEEG